jgi:hypothetical protein
MNYQVIENGPDSTDFVVATFSDDAGAGKATFAMTAKQKAEKSAKHFTEQNAYLGYGYSIAAI